MSQAEASLKKMIKDDRDTAQARRHNALLELYHQAQALSSAIGEKQFLFDKPTSYHHVRNKVVELAALLKHYSE